MLVVQSNLSGTYRALKRYEAALHMRRDVYSGRLRLYGEEHEETISQLTTTRCPLRSKALRRSQVAAAQYDPVARRVLGENDELTIMMRMT